ncbi:early endosome antigen 1 isoform X4 [Boleophthalmus pectinirostris]|uniref:early endosome antigen 1 isoform X4 n=1 Tax=Boleophthalmus pectinirostris TaxID=150288 RepID=UPI0024318767|nr:early endosome antigen 1 isoform X4 [Boleophthalmus pectinirostris]
MSLKENACRKFQANIFNKSKCQNCFKPRESHLLIDEDLNQAKPIYGGWLLLAPEGTNFDNPLHRSRKWQRRFFILYEHGVLRYALDEMPSTLPQGTINMNQCSDVIDGESRTGQKNSLCILTPDKEHFIRAECKEIINGWQEALTVYPRTNKQNQKKKRKVDPPTQQDGLTPSQCFSIEDMNGHPEPGPAKVTVTSSSGGSVPCVPSSIACAERVPTSRASLWQEESRWGRTTIPCSRSASCISQLSQSQPEPRTTTQDDAGTVNTGRKVRVESGYFSLEKTKSEPCPPPPQNLPLSSSASSSSLGAISPRRIIEHFEECQQVECMDTSSSNDPSTTSLNQRQGRSERRLLVNKHDLSLDAGKDRSGPDVSNSTYANLRRAKSLDRRVTESSMTPDLLNFKKGWMTKLYEDGVWKKHWFVLTDQSLRYYKDSIAEEASEMDGEIDLSTCYDVKEFPVQRNYGFQILCKEGACTLSAMTSGIRRNWIQAIMKNVRPTIAPDVTRSLPEDNLKVMLEPCSQSNSEQSPNSETPKSDINNQNSSNNSTTPPSEPRKSRVRERRREGRSKTYDWTEFKMEKPEKPPKERADTVDLSSSFSPNSSYSSSSTPSSIASSPASTSSQPQSTSEDRVSTMHSSTTYTVSIASTTNSSPPVRESQDQGKMEIDHPSNKDRRDSKTSGVQEEIEQRWHQVETTPLREEKQVPITTALAVSSNSDRLPPHELAELLDKELGQKQKELDQLQKQNSLLKEQLEDALGREQSAREGYVLQSATPPSSSPHRVPWQRLHRLNQDLQGELETQKRKQDLAQQQIRTLKRSYTEAQEAVDRHETDIQAFQAKLASAMAEILASEQAVARMRNELKLEQERSKEQEEEHNRSEATLRAQLKDSEDRLRQVEATLLERSQALRHLERQQALQRDHLREIQRLQERLQEVTARLSATEEGQALKEERLKTEQQSLKEAHERERQSLCRRLAEAESTQKDLEERLLEAEQQVEALLCGRQSSAGQEEQIQKLKEELSQKSSIVESLRESVHQLEEEKGHLTCRCQELLNQIAEADREVNKLHGRLQAEEAEYNSLEHSYERATEEFQKMSQFLREKEQEIFQTKEMYERLVERKEEDLKEAFVKMTALGNSLEETEQKLQAKEELLCQMSQRLLEPCNAEKDLQAQLVIAEDRIAELEQHLHALQLGYAGLHSERQTSPEQCSQESVVSNASPTHTPSEESQAKRPRIRFSNIQCQKYTSVEESETPLDTTQKVHLSEGNISSDFSFPHTSDPEKFISIIHALESKLLATEDKLRNLTQNLDRSTKDEDMSKTDIGLRENTFCIEGEGSIEGISINKHYANALVCIENCRQKVRGILSGFHQTTDSQLQSLSLIESDLFNASLCIQQAQHTEQSAVVEPHHPPDALDKDAMLLFAKTLAFEAAVLNKMALLLQTSKADLSQALSKIWGDLENIKNSDKDSLAIVYADMLTKKLMLESAFWKDMERAECQFESIEDTKQGSVSDMDTGPIFNTFIKAELAYSIQNIKMSYVEKFRILKRELAEAYKNLHQREMALKTIIEASKSPDLKNVIKEIKKSLGLSKHKLADIRPPELAPYMEQIEMEEARNMADEIIDRNLPEDILACGVESIQSLENAHEILASELQRQAAILQKYAQELESGDNHPELAKMIHALLGRQTSHQLTSTSLCMREALIQSQVAYVACRLRAMHEQDLSWYKQASHNMDALVQQHAQNVSAIQQKYEASIEEHQQNFSQRVESLENENQTLKIKIGKQVRELSHQQEQLVMLEEHFQKEAEKLRRRHKQELESMEEERVFTVEELMETTADSRKKLEEQHQSQVKMLEDQFELRICELQHLHRDEMMKLQQQCSEDSRSPHGMGDLTGEGQRKGEDHTTSEVVSMMVLKERIQELENQMDSMRDELENKSLDGDMASLREKYQRDFESLKATCERGFAAMEETHQKVIEDIQRQHQREISKLMEERERLLAEETAATIAAIEAMKNAHKEELEKTQRSQLSGLNSDIDELRIQYEEELQSIHRELEVLSEQYSQKCLENAHLAQALEAERQALRQCQRENQELNAHNQELNNRLTVEITRMRSCLSGETAMSPVTQGKDVYELEVLLRIKESEIQYLKQEIHSLKDELQSALRDKKYATDKYKDIYTELSIVKAKADCDISKLKEKLLMATEALGERSVDGSVTSGYDIMKSKSNPDFMKKEQSATAKPSRGLRSKSLKEGLTVQERMKLFEAKDSKKI